jgi:hypothetical protein
MRMPGDDPVPPAPTRRPPDEGPGDLDVPSFLRETNR